MRVAEESERIGELRRLYDAFNRREIDAVLAMLAPDVAWPNMIDRSTIHGHIAVREYWTRQFERIDSHVEPVAFREKRDRVLVTVHQVVRELDGSARSDTHVTHTYTFRDGQVASMEVGPAE